jgi:hypothetical protein
MDFPQLRERAAQFGRHLDAVKSRTEPPPWGWYPFKTLPGFIDLFDQLLTGENRKLIEAPAELRVADIGAADGDLSFFLESVGFQVDLFEGGASWVSDRRMLPPRRLKEALGSEVELHEIDVDRDFKLPTRYNLVFFLGTLYHLRNPLLALESIAHSARYCLLSTRVTRYVPVHRFGRRRRFDVSEIPVAYLVDAHEFSATNVSYHWAFSEAGLKRALARSGWKVLDFMLVGNRRAGPIEGDELRAWCLIESELFDRPDYDTMLLRIEQSGWGQRR